ncbi:hypothetical protein HYT84_03525 [Candidatus Micrarchaeota archaeon]|nr:hypothetical protein [Candidatus Micrarchaeota archaeon]
MEEKNEIKTVSDALQITQIAVDSYDDIFSDFDPSPYETRLLSEDFITELERRSAETKKDVFIIHFTLPREMRSEKTEVLVRKRIKEHFRKALKDLEKIRKEKIHRGLIRIAIGVLISISLFFIPELDATPILMILSVLIWYALWSGFEYVFESPRRLNRKIVFMEKFMKAEYKFMNEEDVIEIIEKIQGQGV